MAGTGGARPGAGRKPKAEKYAGPITKAEKLIVNELSDLVKIQIQLAKGGFEIVEERWEPAGTVMSGFGKYAMKAFPDLPADELVCVERKVSIAAPDRAAGQYLIDRIAGKPVQKIAPTDPSGEKEYGESLTDEAAINRLAAIFDLGRARRSQAAPDEDTTADMDTSAGTTDPSS